jgi:hypothetical protein
LLIIGLTLQKDLSDEEYRYQAAEADKNEKLNSIHRMGELKQTSRVKG